MKSNQKLSLLFWRSMAKIRKSDGKVPIYARITVERGGSKEISTGVWLIPENWGIEEKRAILSEAEELVKGNGGKGELKSKEKELAGCNKELERIETNLEDHFKVLKIVNQHVDAAMLKSAFEGKNEDNSIEPENEIINEIVEVEDENVEQPTTLLEATDVFITEFKKLVDKELRSDDTLRHWKTTKNKLLSFIAFKFKRKDLLLNEIKSNFADQFLNYLTTLVEEPLAEVTAEKHVKNTKQIITAARKNEWVDVNRISDFKCKASSPDVEPLELYEVQAIYEKKGLNRRLEEVRDAYIFQCFTGFAYQDIYALSPEHIVPVGSNHEMWLIKKRGKTEVTEMVPILPIVETLIEKYKNHPYCKVHNKLMPINSNYRYNNYLKELAFLCNITREDIILDTHLARHTFADIMLNVMGVPLEDVSKMLGHKSIRTTQRYCRVKKHRISKNMKTMVYNLFTKDGKLRKVVAA
ncbi:site-specific integrase [Pedobacter sp. ASV28]|uniref:site-specific integrase n=1 Tax=Pedobacter sp. ASV28 TaxID=2795123 RepID=UPI0018ED9D1A|nr:site-specific integrase [Pedobacter sp. ASV28]